MKRLILFELRKIWNKKLSVISVTAVLFLSALLTFSTYQNMYAFDGRGNEGSGGEAVQIDRSIADKYRGVLTDDKVMQMMADFKITADLHGMNAKYLYHNAMQSAVFARFSDMEGNWNGSSVSDVFGEEEIRVGYINGWLHTSRNFAKIILVLSLVIISLISSAALQFLPLLLPVSETSALFRLFVLAPIYQAQCFSILSVQQISGNILYAVWAVPVAVALMVSGMIFPPKIFAGHQI